MTVCSLFFRFQCLCVIKGDWIVPFHGFEFLAKPLELLADLHTGLISIRSRTNVGSTEPDIVAPNGSNQDPENHVLPAQEDGRDTHSGQPLQPGGGEPEVRVNTTAGATSRRAPHPDEGSPEV